MEKLTRNSKWLLAMVATFSLGTGAYWTLFNLFLQESGHSESFIGEITGLVAIGSVISTVPIAWLCGRMKIKWLLIAAVIVNVVGDTFLLFSASQTWIRMGAIVSGMGFASWMTATAPFIMRNAGENGRGRVFSYKHGLGLAASGLASLGFAFLFDQMVSGGSLRADSYLIVLVSASSCKLMAVLFGLFLTPDEPLPEERRRLKEFLVSRDWSALARLTTPSVLIGFGAGMTIPFMNLYFRSRFSMDTGSIGVYFSACTFFMALGSLYGPKIALRIGNIHTVISTQVLSLPFMLILAFTEFMPLAIFAFFARATLMNMGHPLFHHFSMEVVELKEQASTNAFQGLSWNFGWFLGSWLGGVSIELHGFTPTILGTMACYAVATLVQKKVFTSSELVQIGRYRAVEG